MSTENVIAASNAAFPYDIVQLDAANPAQSYLIGYADGIETASDDYTKLPQQYFQVRREATTEDVMPDEYMGAGQGAQLYIANAISLTVNTGDATKCVRIVEHFQAMSDGPAQLRVRTSTMPTLAG